MVLKLRRITDALQTANCGSSTVGVRWGWDQKYWRWADISVGPGQGSGIRIVLLNYEHSVYNILYTVHCKELTTLYGIVNDIIMLRSWIHDTTWTIDTGKSKNTRPELGFTREWYQKWPPPAYFPRFSTGSGGLHRGQYGASQDP